MLKKSQRNHKQNYSIKLQGDSLQEWQSSLAETLQAIFSFWNKERQGIRHAGPEQLHPKDYVSELTRASKCTHIAFSL